MVAENQNSEIVICGAFSEEGMEAMFPFQELGCAPTMGAFMLDSLNYVLEISGRLPFDASQCEVKDFGRLPSDSRRAYSDVSYAIDFKLKNEGIAKAKWLGMDPDSCFGVEWIANAIIAYSTFLDSRPLTQKITRPGQYLLS